jgi:hypothetical protein
MVQMNKVLSGILAVGVVASLAAGAHAQGAQKVDKPISIKIGGLFFTGDAKDLIGSSTISLGVGYDFLKTKAENPVVVQAYLDYFLSKDGDDTRSVGGGESLTTGRQVTVTTNTKMDYAVGIGAAARYQLVRATDTASVFPYAGVGLGIYNLKVKTSSSPAQSTDDSETKTGLGGKVFLGAEFKQGFLAEIEYNLIPKAAELNPSGFGVRIGYRF